MEHKRIGGYQQPRVENLVAGLLLPILIGLHVASAHSAIPFAELAPAGSSVVVNLWNQPCKLEHLPREPGFVAFHASFQQNFGSYMPLPTKACWLTIPSNDAQVLLCQEDPIKKFSCSVRSRSLFRDLDNRIVRKWPTSPAPSDEAVSESRASFDCDRAKSPVEQMICSKSLLGAWDLSVARAYQRARAASEDPAEFDAEAKRALQERDSCTTVECVRQWYRIRYKLYADSIVTPPANTSTRRPNSVKGVPQSATIESDVLPRIETNGSQRTTSGATIQGSAQMQGAASRGGSPSEQRPPVWSQSPAELRVIAREARKMGLQVPLSKEHFLSRHSTHGGVCDQAEKSILGAIKSLTAAVSECALPSPCEQDSGTFACKLVRVAFDASGNVVYFQVTFETDRTRNQDYWNRFERIYGRRQREMREGDNAVLMITNTAYVDGINIDAQALLMPRKPTDLLLLTYAVRR